MSTAARPCEICQQPIDPERLDVIPETHLCTDHAKQIQQFGGEFLVSFSQERISKPGSLKRNYGGITPSKSLNHEGIARLRDAYQSQRGG